MNYREFSIALENRLGTQHLLVDRRAKEPADLFKPTGVHDRLIISVLRSVYKSNECYHIKAPVQLGSTLAAIAPFQSSLRDDPNSDIDVVRLLDELSGAAGDILADPESETDVQANKVPDEDSDGQVISMIPALGARS